MSSNQYYVYILSNTSRNVLYVGVTNDLVRRVWEHKNDVVKGFTQRYKIHDLVYYEVYNDIESAISREKQMKSWNRSRKEKLILEFNKTLEDLYTSIV